MEFKRQFLIWVLILCASPAHSYFLNCSNSDKTIRLRECGYAPSVCFNFLDQEDPIPEVGFINMTDPAGGRDFKTTFTRDPKDALGSLMVSESNKVLQEESVQPNGDSETEYEVDFSIYQIKESMAHPIYQEYEKLGKLNRRFNCVRTYSKARAALE